MPLVIVGGGMAGLSAAWRLDKQGFHDFVLLEMGAQAGGNSRWGENDVSAYPWGAHYVPVPGKNATLVRELLEDLGVLTPEGWSDRYLCFSPQERLFLHGRWQEGIEPALSITARDREQYKRFEQLIGEFRSSGQFTIPMETGARPSPLDKISIADWLRQERLDSPYLDWYINYACRDDFGALAQDTSAWAGIHYFASREPEEKGPLTWPEGNGWIARRLLEKLGRFVRTGAAVTSITGEKSGFRVRTAAADYLCELVIFAAPTFLAPFIVDAQLPGMNQVTEASRRFQYSPWLTANLTLDRLPREQDWEPAWDNVIYNSPALGYVVATHQSLRTVTEKSVWTFYWALAGGAPAENRRLLLAKDWGYWKEAILNDLAAVHPDIRSCVARIDVLRLGHAMIRPAVGFLFSDERQRVARLTGRLVFANSDLSGFSIFEEAQYRGVKAANQALRLLSGRRS